MYRNILNPGAVITNGNVQRTITQIRNRARDRIFVSYVPRAESLSLSLTGLVHKDLCNCLSASCVLCCSNAC